MGQIYWYAFGALMFGCFDSKVMSHTETTPARCQECETYGHCFAHQLAIEGIDAFQKVHPKNAAAGPNVHLFRAGEATNELHIIRSGSVKTYRLSPDGDEVALGFFLPGEIVGLEALAASSHQHFAVTLEPTQTCDLTVGEFKQVMRDDPKLSETIFRSLCSALDHAQNLLLIVGHLEAKARVAFFMLSLSHRLGQCLGDENRFKLPMDRRDIANHLGLTIETISRVLSQFQRDGVVKVDGKHVQIINRRALERLARPGDQPPTRSAAALSQPTD